MLFDVRFPGQLQNGVTRGAQHPDFFGSEGQVEMATGAYAHQSLCDREAPGVDDIPTQVLGSPRIGADIPAKLLSLIGRWLPVVSCPIRGGGVV